MENSTQTLRQAGVDLNGLMSVLSRHLYSTPTVALRELVQNAHDAIVRRRLEQPSWQDEARIDIVVDSKRKQLRIIDTGAGLTEDEIHHYLATVGVGYTRKLRHEDSQNSEQNKDSQNKGAQNKEQSAINIHNGKSNTTGIEDIDASADDTGLIGMFGLGFLSAFVLAKRVIVSTTSYQTPHLRSRYISSNAKSYAVSTQTLPESHQSESESISASTYTYTIGTEVLLELQDDFFMLLQINHVREVLSHYCALLIEPIYIHDIKDLVDANKLMDKTDSVDALELGLIQTIHRQAQEYQQTRIETDSQETDGRKTDSQELESTDKRFQAINADPPPWRVPNRGKGNENNDENKITLHPKLARKQALKFASRFEKNFEPICTMDVKPQGESDAIGMLWVQDGATFGTSDNRNLSVFLRGMLLDDDARDLLPNWAGFIGGVIESQQLTPTASREDLQRDRQFDNTRHALSEALISGLSQLAKEQPEAWRRVLRRHNEALLGAALCDERLFLLLIDSLQIPTSNGDLTAKQLVSKGALHVVLDDSAGFEDMLFRALGVPVAMGNRYAVVPFLRHWAEIKGLRLIELGTRAGNQQLFKTKLLAQKQKQWLETQLCHDERLIIASFVPASLPLIVVPDREQALKRRIEEDNKDKTISQAALSLARQFTKQIKEDKSAKLYLNTDNPAVQDLLSVLDSYDGDNVSSDDQGNKDDEYGKQAQDAAMLLRTFKTLLAVPTDPEHSAERLQQALSDLATSVQILLRDVDR